MWVRGTGELEACCWGRKLDKEGTVECANCGTVMALHRRETQFTGLRQVELEWFKCAGCRHVMLRNWSYSLDTTPPRVEAPV